MTKTFEGFESGPLKNMEGLFWKVETKFYFNNILRNKLVLVPQWKLLSV